MVIVTVRFREKCATCQPRVTSPATVGRHILQAAPLHRTPVGDPRADHGPTCLRLAANWIHFHRHPFNEKEFICVKVFVPTRESVQADHCARAGTSLFPRDEPSKFAINRCHTHGCLSLASSKWWESPPFGGLCEAWVFIDWLFVSATRLVCSGQ